MMPRMINEPVKRSRLGLASFLVAIGTFALVVVMLLITFILTNKRGHGFGEEFAGATFFTFVFVAPVAHLVGLVMGIVALFQKKGMARCSRSSASSSTFSSRRSACSASYSCSAPSAARAESRQSHCIRKNRLLDARVNVKL